MKKLPVILCAIGAFLLAQTTAAQPTRRALLVAVGQYAPESGWPELASGRDAGLLHDVLVRQGFPDADIRILRDTAATLAGIRQALLTLQQSAKPGDIVLIHFSGHGQQVADDNRDEIDGYDEALVPYDSPMRFQTGMYEGERLLRDDVLNQHIKALRKKLGPSGAVLVLLDACHSGTGLRGDAATGVRGTDLPMANQAYQDAHRDLTPDPNALVEGPHTDNTAKNAPVVAFFAASAHEANYETRDEQGQRIGSLTYAFCKAFTKATPTTTYRAIFDQIKTEINSHATLQNPQAEGALDRRVLDGKIAGCPPHFEVKTVADPHNLLLSAGQLSGISEGSELVFYPIGAYDTTHLSPVATGVVASADLLESVVSLNKPAKPGQLDGAWAFLRSQVWKTDALRVRVALPEGIQTDSVMAALRRWKRVVLTQTGADFFITTCVNAPGQLCLNARGQVAERTITGADRQPDHVGAAVVAALSDLAMANFLRGLSLEDDALQARLGFVSKTSAEDTISATLSFHANRDTVALKVTNIGQTGCYFSLIDIQPDGQINVVVPQPGGYTAEDYYLKPGAFMQFAFGWFTPPTGTEVFKLIISREPLDLSPVVQSRGSNVRGMQQPNIIESLLAQRYDTSLNRGSVHLPPGGITVKTLAVRIE